MAITKYTLNSESLIERLMRNVEMITESGCWIWMGADKGNGYGMVRYHYKVFLTHRVSYEFFRGPIPDGLELDHLCRVTFCCNPWHLEAVTHQVNCQRGTGGTNQEVLNLLSEISKARSKSITRCPQGHPYNAENTVIYSGFRNCRICRYANAARIRREHGIKERIFRH